MRYSQFSWGGVVNSGTRSLAKAHATILAPMGVVILYHNHQPNQRSICILLNAFV